MEIIGISFICFILIGTKLQICVEAKARFQIDGTGMECSSDSPLVANKLCKMTQTTESKQLYNIDVYFKDGIEINELFLRFSWMYKTANNMKYKPFLGLSNLTVDLCYYLVNGNSMLVDLFLDDVKKVSNIIHKCPFKCPRFVFSAGMNNVMRFNTQKRKNNVICIWVSIRNGHCYVKGLGANVKKFPAIIPSGEYYMILLFYTKLNELEHILLNLKLTANVKTVNFG